MKLEIQLQDRTEVIYSDADLIGCRMEIGGSYVVSDIDLTDIEPENLNVPFSCTIQKKQLSDDILLEIYEYYSPVFSVLKHFSGLRFAELKTEKACITLTL